MRTTPLAPLVYSPLPAEMYKAPTVDYCEVRSILQIETHSAAVWNLFWLSTPSIDRMPGAGTTWFRHHQPDPKAAAAITADVLFDEPLLRKLCMHPSSFYEWFERQDHSIFDTYYVLGEGWIDTVLTRAAQAISRIAADGSVREGNVIYHRFG